MATTTAREWLVRQYQPGDEEGIRQLVQVVHPARQDTVEYWEWQFKNNPAGFAEIWLAVVGERVVGQYVIIPMRLKIRGRDVLGSLSLDTITHPDYRRQGMFEVLARHTYESAGRRGLHITFGVPNELSYPGFVRKLEWFDIARIAWMRRVLDFRRLAASRIRNRFVAGVGGGAANLLFNLRYRDFVPAPGSDLHVDRIESFDDRFDDLWAKASSSLTVAVVRDKEYLNWRYVDKPGREYVILAASRGRQLAGYAVLKPVKSARGHGYIVDLFTVPSDEPAAQALVSSAMRYFRREGIALASCWTLENCPHYQVLKKAGFLRRKTFTPLGARLNTGAVSQSTLSDAGNWFYAMGDNDWPG